MLTVKNPKNTNWANMPLNELAKGNALDTYFTFKLNEILNEEIKKNNQEKLIKYLINPSLPIFAKMELKGLLTSEEELDKLDKDLKKKIMEFEDEIFSLPMIKGRTDLNLNSSPQLAEILYSDEYYDLYPPDFTDGGEPSTSADTLTILLEQINVELKLRA